MIRLFRFSIIVGFCASLAPAALNAAPPAAVEFSADTYQTAPDQGERSGKIYVGKQYVRTDMQHAGQQVVRVVNSETGAGWVIYPQHRSFMQIAAATAPDSVSADKGNPCYGMPSANCKMLGEEAINGQVAVKWSVSVNGPNGQVQSTQWFDKERNILLRQSNAQGMLVDQTLVGSEKLQSRPVEKWQMTVTQPGKQPQQSLRWFDTELGLAIREEYPGGYVRELRNVQVAPQPASLFQLPAGYQQIQPQRGAMPQRQ